MNKHYSNLIKLIDEIVVDKAIFDIDHYRLSVNQLDENELGQIAGLFIENDDYDTSECFYNPNQYSYEDDITNSLLKVLKNNNKEARDEFVNRIIKRAINRYKDNIQKIIDERCDNYLHETQYMRKYG